MAKDFIPVLDGNKFRILILLCMVSKLDCIPL